MGLAWTGKIVQLQFLFCAPQKYGGEVFPFPYFALQIKVMVNLAYRWLDKIDYDDNSTLNFVVVARKPIQK